MYDQCYIQNITNCRDIMVMQDGNVENMTLRYGNRVSDMWSYSGGFCCNIIGL